MDVRDILTPECDLDVENMFELEAEIITLQEKVTTLEDKLSRANDAKNFCLARAQKHQIEYKTHVNEIETRHYEATTLAQSRHAETVQNMVQQLDEMRRRIKDLESTEAKKIEYIKFQDATIKSLKLRLRARGKPAGKIGQNHIEPNGPRKRKRENSSTIEACGIIEWSQKEVNLDRVLPMKGEGPIEATNGTLQKSKKVKLTAVVRCTRCSAQGLSCDNSATCEDCTLSHKPCKRAMCRHFEKSRCFHAMCGYAHEDDGFTNLVPFTRVLRNCNASAAQSKMAKTKKQAAKQMLISKPLQTKLMGKKTYEGLFEEIRERLNRNDDDDDASGLLPR